MVSLGDALDLADSNPARGVAARHRMRCTPGLVLLFDMTGKMPGYAHCYGGLPPLFPRCYFQLSLLLFDNSIMIRKPLKINREYAPKIQHNSAEKNVAE